MKSKLDVLKDILGSLENALIAYSGGVDSVFLLKVASECLPNRVIAVTAISPSYPTYELDEASALAREIGVEHVIVRTHELEDERYRANLGDRCYFCKSELYSVCGDITRERNIPWILNGVNVDDLGDHRPGLKAADEKQVRSPLVEAGLTKKEIREYSKELGLRTWNKQALACLSSRFPPGTEVTEEKLQKIDRIETRLVNLGFQNFRVRFHEPIARIEVGREDFDKFMDEKIRGEVTQVCRDNGFLYAALDLDGYRMGNLNQLILPSWKP
jgi:uncharacterized protein